MKKEMRRNCDDVIICIITGVRRESILLCLFKIFDEMKENGSYIDKCFL